MTDIYQDIEAQIPRLRRYARSLVRDVAAADDLVQECLARALGKLHLWQQGSDLRAWLFTILHNQHVNQIRRRIRTGTAIELDRADLPGRPPDQDNRLELRDLDRALGRLPEAQRAVILMIGLEGMHYHEVAAVLDIPVGTVRSRLSRGRGALRRMISGEPGERAAAGTRRGETPYLPARRVRPAVAATATSVISKQLSRRHEGSLIACRRNPSAARGHS